MKKIVIQFFTIFIMSLNLLAQNENNWPKTIKTNEDFTINIYSPQNSSYLDNKLESNIVFSLNKKNEEPIFGMMWVTTLLDIDRQTRMGTFTSLKINEIRFSKKISDAYKIKFEEILNIEIPKWNIEFTMEDLITSMAEVNIDKVILNNEAPRFIFSYEPSVLILIDGTPKFKEAEQGYEVIINSGSLIINEKKSNKFFLKGGNFWYTTKDITGNWETTNEIPSEIRKIEKKVYSNEKEDFLENDNYDFKIAPKIIVSKEISELVVFEGEPEYSAIKNTKLQFAKNTDSDLFLHTGENNYYILISGRWFYTDDIEKNWTYINAEDLPFDFSKIAKNSKKANVLVSIPGTQEAKEAIYDAQLPLTASVKRITKPTDVIYQGRPVFEKIKDIDLQYALNTESDVFKVENDYYLCDNAIWFKSKSATGPWEVANERPEDVKNIPADNPKYHTKFVYIYETSPDVVYVGHTPGYYGSYISGPTMVYGSGYYYNPWYNGHYYHHHYTYGFSIRYTPFNGWNIAFSYGSPLSWYGYSYWGPNYHHWGSILYRPSYYRRDYIGRPRYTVYHKRNGVVQYSKPYVDYKPEVGSRPNIVKPDIPNLSVPETRPSFPENNRLHTIPSAPINKPISRPTARPLARPTAISPSNSGTKTK